jgi:glutathione S-transferase
MPMLILRSSPASPFGRKVRIAAALCGLSERISIEKADTTDPSDSLRQQNPLGKMPVLVLEDGTRLYDSSVIVEWLDHEAGGGVVLPLGPTRFPALVLQALADGIMDASILTLYESRYRPEEKHHQPWLDHQAGKIERALAELEREPPALDARPHVGHIALACALGYRDFRFDGTWRAGHPRLAEWLDRFAAAVLAYEATAPY